MDGVILDSEKVYQEIERSMYRELGIPVSREEHLEFMGTAERSMWTRMHEKYSLERTVNDLVQEEQERFMDRLRVPGDIPLIEGIIPLLKELQSEKIPCWIASSSSSEIIARVIKINSLEEFYRGYVGGDDVSQSKPSPEIFLKAANLEGTRPENCVVIEDSENGVKAALAAGMDVIGLKQEPGSSPDLSKASRVVSRLSEIDVGLIRQFSDKN